MLVLLLFAAGLVARPALSPAAVNYRNFTSVKGLQLNGDAFHMGDTLTIMSPDAGQTGSAFTKKTIVDPRKSFRTSFRFLLHDSTTAPGDGMAFVIVNGPKTALGEGGGGLGYSGLHPSLDVEFDKFENPEAGDPDANHVAVMKNGNTGNHLKSVSPAFDLFGGKRYVWISYSAKSKKLKLWISDSAAKPKKPQISLKENLKSLLEGKSRAGFTASSGGNNMATDILRWKLGH